MSSKEINCDELAKLVVMFHPKTTIADLEDAELRAIFPPLDVHAKVLTQLSYPLAETRFFTNNELRREMLLSEVAAKKCQ